jgi:hypothetical protein
LQWIGRGWERTLSQNGVNDGTAVRELTASLNVQTSLMEVGCILSDESEGNIIFNFNVKGSDVVEPLCYVRERLVQRYFQKK